MKKNYLLLFGYLLLFVACSQSSLFNLLSKNNLEPLPSKKPVVDSFKIDRSIVVSWEQDQGTDTYILYRSQDCEQNYEEIYRGSDLKYVDDVSSYDIDTFFYYKLAKKRESVEFFKSNYAYGVVAKMKDDDFEDNDSIGSATSLDNKTSLNGTLHIYRDKHGNTLADIDWFKVTIDSKIQIKYLIDIENNGITDGCLNVISVDISAEDQSLNDESIFRIKNTTNFSCVKYFKLVTVPDKIFHNPMLTAGKTFQYIIKFHSATELGPAG